MLLCATYNNNNNNKWQTFLNLGKYNMITNENKQYNPFRNVHDSEMLSLSLEISKTNICLKFK